MQENKMVFAYARNAHYSKKTHFKLADEELLLMSSMWLLLVLLLDKFV